MEQEETVEYENEGLDAEIEAAENMAEDFAQPGDEDYDENLKYESVEQTHERTLKALKETQEPQQGQNAGDGRKDQSKEPEKQPQGKSDNQNQQVDIPAPDRFRAEAREAWKTAPRALKEEYARAIQDLESGQTKKLREIHDIKVQSETVVNAIAPWTKEWAAKGISPHQGVALLAQTHERMLENPAKEIARLIADNGLSVADIQAVVDGGDGTGGNGQGMAYDITRDPKFIALQERLDSYDNERHQQMAKAETDKIIALRDFTDEAGNKPYGNILDTEFLQYAQPLVNALRTPPRDAEGKFTGGPPMSLEDAYKKAYFTWQHETGKTPQISAPSHQPSINGTHARKPAEPVAMRPRNKPVGATPVSNGAQGNLHETVEQTMERLKRNNWQ